MLSEWREVVHCYEDEFVRYSSFIGKPQRIKNKPGAQVDARRLHGRDQRLYRRDKACVLRQKKHAHASDDLNVIQPRDFSCPLVIDEELIG